MAEDIPTSTTGQQTQRGNSPEPRLEIAGERRAKKPRISVACSPCHARKQKCDGARPVCRRCVEEKLLCSYPVQKKRGPSKHYIQALETRLLETENALFRALSVLTQQQLPSVPFSQQPQDPPSNSLEPVTDKPYLFRKDKKFGTEYWAQFSLGSEAEIARWFQDHGGVLQQLTSGVNPSAALDLDYGSSHSSNPAVLHDVQTNPRTPDTATALRVEAGYSSPQASEKPNQVDSRKFAHIRNAQAEKVTRRSILHITIDPKSENHSLSLNVGTSSTSKAAPQSQETRLAEEDFLW